ncbi:MAG: hypothetical protein JF612_02170, partial [Planctomycetia bacterium]|nr:hypothetical protein [Planctomycetia bacterium]
IASDGFTVVAGGNDAQLLLWDLRSPMAAPVELGRHRTYIHCVAFSPDGRALLTGSEDGVVKLWDMPSRRLKRSLRRHTSAVASAAFSPDGQQVATVSWDGSVKLWDPATDDIVLQQGISGQVFAVAYTPDGKSLLSGGDDGLIRVWNLAASPEPLVLKGQKGLLRAVAFSLDGQKLVSAGGESIRLWDVTGKQEPMLFDNSHCDQPSWFAARPQLVAGGKPNRVMGAAITRENMVLAGDFGGRIRRLGTSASSDSITFEEADGPLWSLAISPDGETLAAAAYRSNTVVLWDVATGKKRLTLSGHSDRVWSVAFAPDGRTVASGANDMTVRLWDVASGTQIRKIPVPIEWVYTLAFTPDSQMIAIAGGDNRIRLYEVKTGREQAPLGQHPATVRALAFFPDGKTLATGSDDGTVKLWDLATRQQRITLHAPPLVQISTLADGTTTTDMFDSSVWSLAIAADGRALAAGDGDGRVTIWRTDAKTDDESAASRP